MQKQFFIAALGIAAVAAMASSANAQYAYPKKANKYQTTMVQAYAACTAPDDTTTGTAALPACSPAVRNDTVCGFDISDPAKPAGQGQLQAVTTGKGATADVKLQVKLQGLNAGCIGETLCIEPFVRVSTLGCTSGDPGGCTILEALTNPYFIDSLPPSLACGVVDDKGKLQIKTTVDTAAGVDLLGGDVRLNLDLARTGVRRVTGPSVPAPGTLSFAAGVSLN